MQDQTKATTQPIRTSRPNSVRPSPIGRRPLTPPGNAFSAHFLDRARRREDAPGPGESLADTPLARQDHWAGPWEAEAIPAGDGVLHVVGRRQEPVAEGGGARLAFLRRQDALLAAATLTALATPNHLSLNTDKRSGRRNPLGHPIHDGTRHLGHITPAVRGAEDLFLTAFHAVRCLAAHPDAAALLIEALGTDILGILGRASMWRVG